MCYYFAKYISKKKKNSKNEGMYDKNNSYLIQHKPLEAAK